ncbi:CD109 antigen isoform X4 [Condylostylus longicornis]|uniref:CD109 antigen isoform X4 n=1 Tax=Condylostylus longicornis TaxID=2530218 RepID=UPI00244DDA2B|nr:CD109 antigen isoform X4 [Condylostylus longicornis]
MLKNIGLIVACLLQVATITYGDDNSSDIYTVVAPGTIRANSDYHVSVSIHQAKQPAEVKVGVEGEKYKDHKTVMVDPMSTEIVKFKIPDIEDGTYKLTVEGEIGDKKFSNSTELNFAKKYYSVFIQTDKATYKPEDLVRFRVLVLDSNTRPFDKKFNGINIIITDSAQNRIKQFLNVDLTKGVYSGELQLSSFPVLGNWNIEVSVDGEQSQKGFEVAKYVLPKFEVQIDTPRDVSVADGKIRAIVRSKYTYGKPVKGSAKVSVEPSYRIWNVEKQPYAEKTVPVDGKGKVEFDLKELNFTNDDESSRYHYYPPVKMTAIVEEELTGLKQNTSTTITLHRDRYKIEGLPENPQFYEPGIPFKIRLAVKNFDNTPVIDSSDQVVLEVEKPRHHYRPIPLTVGVTSTTGDSTAKPAEEEEVENQKIPGNIDKQGIVTFEVTIPSDSKDSFYSLKATFKEQTAYLGSVSKKTPREGDYFVIENLTDKPALGKDVELKVSSNKPIPYFNYHIVGRGNILKSEHVQLPENTKEHTIKFTPTFEMIPNANVMVYFVSEGNLNFEETNINFENELENQVDITVPEQAKPGEDVSIKVNTSPDSYVGLLGVDQSVLLLKSGNDIAKSDVFSELTRYGTTTPWIRGWGRYPGQQSGLVTLTNSAYPFDERPKFLMLRGGRPGIPGPYGPVGVAYSASSAVDYAVGASSFSVRTFMSGPTPKPVVVRKEFPETWVFTENVKSIDNNGEIVLKEKVPDTITSWVLTAFSVNSKTGLGITKDATKLRVFQPFFVSTNLPYSVKRGEVLSVPVIIFNYLEKDLDAEITMDNTDQEYEFAEATNEIEEKSIEDIKRSKRLTVPANSGKSTSFMIRPKNVGNMAIKIQATTPIAGDAIQQMLPVEPEGVTQYVNKAIFINLKDGKEQSEKVKIEIPDDAVPDSQYAEVSVVGDLLGPTIKNLDKLVRMPYGCGEQNMVNFVPNILVMKYLTNINQLTPTIESKAKKYMEVGYQKELTYKHSDGSYSAFGENSGWGDNKKNNGSTWLTAYVVRSFHQAIPYIDIDQNVIDKGLSYLASVQTPDGRFPEYGKLLDKAHSGESDTGISLTSFVLLAFLENTESRVKYEENIQKAITYLTNNLDKLDTDIYATAITAYALKLAKAPTAEKVSEKLKAMAKVEGDRKWWAKPEEKKEKNNEDNWWYRPKSADVEQTAYALLSILADNGPAEDTLPILKWLISKRNSNGGFASTQDTVVGLTALIGFSEKFSSGKSGKLDIDFNDDTGASGKISVNPENALLLQTHVLSNKAREVSMSAKGEGSSLAQVSYKYNVVAKNSEPRFAITPKVKDAAVKDILMLDVCVKYIPIEHDVQSNMAVVEINLPSGYEAPENDGSLDNIKSTKTVQRVETKNKNTVIVVYFDSIGSEEICIPVEATKTSQVAKQKPAAIEAYDYYNSGNRGIAYYEIKSSLCDICFGDDCGDGCKKPENP